MARKPSTKPWLHTTTGFWCATVQGKRHYLDRNYRVACSKLKELRNQAKREEAGGKEWLDSSFAELASEYLSDIQAKREHGTYVSARYRLLRALKILGKTVRVGELRKAHLSKIERALTSDRRNYSPTTIKDTLTIVNGVMNWAVKQDYFDTNPLAGYEKPAARRRNRIIEPDEFQALLRAADVSFRRFLITLRLTGCRPGELRTLIWEWVDLDNGVWILAKHKTITRQREPRPRIVPLPEAVLNLCHRLNAKQHGPSDFVFLNQHGSPYSKDSLVKKMARIRDRAGIQVKAGEQLVMYSNRHTYATGAVGKVSDVELAQLMGHTDTRMLTRYVHLSVDRLRDAQRRVSRGDQSNGANK